MSKLLDFLNRFADGKEDVSFEFELPSFKREVVEDNLETELLKARQARAFFSNVYRIFGMILSVVLVLMLIYTVINLPKFGAEDAPTNNEVYEKYVEEGLSDTGAVNSVAGMILDYRAFDTLGESAVLFTAASAVIILILEAEGKKKEVFGADKMESRNTKKMDLPTGNLESKDIILRTISRYLIPCIVLFGIYIVLNGHISPGGGFSGGAVMGAGFILYANVFGADRVLKFFNKRIYTLITSGSLLAYGCLKCFSFYTGANHIETHIPKGVPGNIISAGFILPLNIFVGLIVCSTMLSFYLLFTKGEI